MSSDTYKIGYVRCSTASQDESLQLDAMKRAQVDRVFIDKASGVAAHRPGLAEALDCARSGDSIVVWKLDRLGRSLKQLIDVVGDMEKRGITLVSLTESIDTSTASGRLMLHVLGALAEMERDLIRERTNAGLAAARERGRVGGRPSVWTAEKLATARSMHAGGQDPLTIARVLGVSRSSVYRALQEPAA